MPKQENLTLFDWMTVYTYVDSPSDLCEVATTPNDHSKAEEELLDLVAQLKARRHITGKPFTLNEMLDPKEEQEIGECLNVVDGGDLEIIAMVQSKVGLARGDIKEIDSNSDDDNLEVVPPSLLLFCTDVLNFVEAAHRF